MDKPDNTADTQATGHEDKLDPAGMVPAAGKHATRPSEVERRDSMHQTDPGGTTEGAGPGTTPAAG